MNPELPKFIDFTYSPTDEWVPGRLTIRCQYEKWSAHEVEGDFIFQYLEGKVFFRVYPTLVQLPLGEAASVDEAVELGKQFLGKWLSQDILKYGKFQVEMGGEILRLEEEQRKEKEAQINKSPLEEWKRRIAEAWEQNRKRAGEG